MATQAQIKANRRNAKKSTGPKTDAGRAAVAQNAIKHGLTAAAPVIATENLVDYAAYRQQMLPSLTPVGPMETMLADRIIDLSWRLKRADRLQTTACDELASAEPHPNPLGALAVKDFSDTRVLERLLIYERRIEHSLYRTMLELQRLQFIRTKYQSLLYDHADYDDIETQQRIQDLNQTPKGA